MSSEVRIFNAIEGPKPQPGDSWHFGSHLASAAPLPVLPVTVPLPPGHPWNQDGLGTCIGNGCGLACVVAIHRATGRWIVESAQAGEALAHDLYHGANPGDSGYKQGARLIDALRFAQSTGVIGQDGKRYKIKTFHSLLPSTDINGDVERALAAGMAVATGWKWSAAWMADPAAHFDTLPHPGAPWAGGHCVAIWRAVMKHPSAGTTALRRDHDLEQSWGAWGVQGGAYFDAALERDPTLLFDAYAVTA